MKDEMMLVGVTLARRYTRKQKEIFLAEVCRQCREAGWKTGISNPAFPHAACMQSGHRRSGACEDGNCLRL